MMAKLARRRIEATENLDEKCFFPLHDFTRGVTNLNSWLQSVQTPTTDLTRSGMQNLQREVQIYGLSRDI